MSTVFDKALSEYAAAKLAALSERIRTLITHCNSDLYFGPVYLDSDGDICAHGDEGATPFDFVAACSDISDALDDISDAYYQDWAGMIEESRPLAIDPATDEECEADESEYAIVERSDIIAAIVGRELAQHL